MTTRYIVSRKDDSSTAKIFNSLKDAVIDCLEKEADYPHAKAWFERENRNMYCFVNDAAGKNYVYGTFSTKEDDEDAIMSVCIRILEAIERDHRANFGIISLIYDGEKLVQKGNDSIKELYEWSDYSNKNDDMYIPFEQFQSEMNKNPLFW